VLEHSFVLLAPVLQSSGVPFMKKLLLTLLVCYQSVSASTWFEYAHTTKATFQYEHETVTTHNNQGAVFVVWSRTMEKDKITKVVKQELHCASRTTRTVMEVRYSPDGDVVFQEFSPYKPFIWAVPDSTDMILIEWVCAHY
jgi:hypothetical protein